MTDNEIKKALDCCANLFDCPGCPYQGDCGNVQALTKDALDLINRLTEQNEGLQEEVAIKTDMLNRQKAEIERLNIRIKDLTNYQTADIETRRRVIANAKTEAIKKFAERFQQEIQESKYRLNDSPYARACNQVADWCIEVSDNLAKEMVGDDNA